MANIDLLIYNARIVNEGVTIPKGYLTVSGEFISGIGEGEPDPELLAGANDKIDAEGKYLLPGVIDTHVHFRDPGLTHKGDMHSESTAAIAGGVTSFIDMPNTKPPTISVAEVEAKLSYAAEVSLANYGFFIGATNSNLEELRKADYSHIAGVKLFLGSSTGNMLVDEPSTIEKIFSDVPALIAVHAEDEATIAANRKKLREALGEEIPIDCHPVIRDHEACYLATRRAVELAKATGARLHVCHISTSDELRLFTPGAAADKHITAETCPQYLVFTDEMYGALGSRIKCNPAIKRPTDRDDLRFAVNHDIIDTIATDHAPHLWEEKRGTALTAASGMPGIEFSLPVMMQAVSEQWFSVETIVWKMCHNPATIFNIDRRGFLREGYYADLVIFDPDCEPYTIKDENVKSLCGWTPYNGLQLSGKVDITILNGSPAYRYGTIFKARTHALRFNPPVRLIE